MTAQTLTWVPGTSGGWFDAGNWTVSGGIPSSSFPQTSDTAIVNSGTAQISSGGQILGETIKLGGVASGGTVSLTATDTTFAPVTSGTGQSGFPKVVTNEFLMVTGGGSSSPVNATLIAHGTTTFEGELIVEPINGTLTISAAAAGGESGHFEILNKTDATLGLVTQEAALHLTGQQITTSAVIEVEGSIDIAAGTTLDGKGIVALENGGHASISGTVGVDQQIDFADGTGSVAIASGASVFAMFGFPGIAGARIDLQGVSGTSETVSNGVLTVFSGGTAVASLNVQAINAGSLNPAPTSPQPATADFTLASDGSGGTLITYAPPGPLNLYGSLPAPVVAPTGTLVSLQAIMGQSFGPTTPNFYGITLLPPGNPGNTTTNFNYWSSPVAPAWYVNGVQITSNYAVKPGDNVQLLVGDNITNAAQLRVQLTPTVTSSSGEYVTYNVWTVDPTVASIVQSGGVIPGHPTSGGIQAAANALNTVFPDVVNNDDCPWIADAVAAAAGAVMPLPDASLDPTQNVEGGFWRIVYRGSDFLTPPQDWSAMVEPGDIIRMAWFHPTSPADMSGHTTTALSTVSGGMISFYDNDDHPADLPSSIIGIHDDNYWNRTDPASITIYRLAPDQQYLISGTSQSEVIQGSVYNNLIRPGGGADVITAGAGNNEIQDTTAHLSSITITDFHLGDEIDFTDLNPAQATVDYTGTQLLVSSGGVQVADITLPAQLPPTQAFIVTPDSASGSLITLSTVAPITWANSGGGQWSSASNWSGGVPAPDDYAIINISGTYTVTVASDAAVNALNVSNPGATVFITGATLAAGQVTTDGEFRVASGATLDVLVSGTFSDIVSGGGTVELGGVSGTALTFSAGVTSATVIDFAGAAATLKLVRPEDFLGTIDGFAPGQTIDLTEVRFDPAGTVQLLSGNVLEVKEDGSTFDLRLDPAQSFAGKSFHLVSDRARGTDIILDTTVSAGETLSVTSGQTVVGLTILSGGILEVFPGGVASATTVSNGGLVEVFSNGTVTSTNVRSGGTAEVFGGALTSATAFASGGILQIGSYRVESSLDVVNGLTVSVLFSGTAISGTVRSNGALDVLFGGTALDTTISGGGALNVSNGGVISNTTIGSGGVETASSGGGAVNARVTNGGMQIVRSGGTTDGTTIASTSAYQLVSGTAVDTTVSGGAEVVYGGGTANGATIVGGGVQYIASGGTAEAALVLSGGQQNIGAGGTASATMVSSGGIALAGAGASLGGAIIEAGGYELMSGTASGTTLSGGAEVVYSGGIASGTTVSSGGMLYVASGGIAKSAVVSSGGQENIGAGGTTSGAAISGGAMLMDAGQAINTTLAGGAAAFVTSGGTISNTTVAGADIISSGAVASGTILAGGVEVLLAGGIARAASVGFGGIEYIASGGVASGAVVSFGGQENIAAGGLASGGAISANGLLLDAGTASAVVVSNGGAAYVEFGGVAVATVLRSGGTDVILNGGLASGTIFSSGGTEAVFSGGRTTSALVTTGGLEDVASGGLASATVISGGTLEVASGGATGSGAVTFAVSGGGILQLDDSVHYGGLVAGFGQPDFIDLRDIAFNSATTTLSWTQVTSGANASGTLTVADTVHSAGITLLGQYVVGQFTKQSDGHGGTLVGDPPVVAQTDPAPAALVNPHQV